jgi:ABC-type uncharacterized transport system fused permease/ATPase subunit
LDAEGSFGAKGWSGTGQSKGSSDREAVGVTRSEELPDTENPGAGDRSSPADTGNDLDETLEDTSDGAAEGVRRRYLLRRFWRSAAGFWGPENRSAWPLSGAVLLIILLNLGTLKVLRAWRGICAQTMKTTIVSQTSGYIAPILPVVLCAPKYLDGSMSLGQVMQAASAFTIVQMAFNWLVDNYPRLADLTASARRVSALMLSLDALEKAEGGQGISRIHRNDDGETAALTLRELSITLDDGTAVVDEAEVAIKQGERVLIAGDSGTGKSTLIRAIAGLWPWGEGKIEVRKGAKLMFLPQRPYIPIG